MSGPESDLVDVLLDNIEKFYRKDLEYEVCTEPYSEIGIPDVVVIGWDRSVNTDWNAQRNKLNKADLKILHHVACRKNRGILIEKISFELGFTEKKITQSLARLVDAVLIQRNGERIFIMDFESNFFLRQIITIEAKIKNWKDAYYQAEINQNFASHSYVLLPEKIIKPQLKSTFNGSIGLLGKNEKGVVVKKKAKKGSLPRSYFSWVLNEHIGRKVFSSI